MKLSSAEVMRIKAALELAGVKRDGAMPLAA
jgi:hypothetical protein